MVDRYDIIKMAKEAGFTNPERLEIFGIKDENLRGILEDFWINLERFAALVAAAERESVAASSKRDLTCVCGAVWEGDQMVHAPPKREWVGLTDEEIDAAWRSVDYTVPYNQFRIDVAREIESKLKEKNGG